MSLPIVFRGQSSGPLSCATYDANLLACLDRGNATGTQLAATISDLYTTVEGYDFITALQTCCTTLTTNLNNLQQSIFGEGELSTVISALRTELLGDIATVQTSLTNLTTRVTTDEATLTSLGTSISTLASAITGLTTGKANIDSPTFTGIPQAPTPNSGASSTQIATVGYVTNFSLPIGVILPYGGGTPPSSNFALAVGQAISRTTYAGLFAIFGTTYGAGDGATTFNLPNLQSRVPIGVGSGYTLGSTGGEATHTLVTAEMPSHIHTSSNTPHAHTGNVPHFHDLLNGGNTLKGINLSGGDLGSVGAEVSNSGSGAPAVTSTDSPPLAIDPNTIAITIGSTGNDQPHNNMQPYITLNYIVKIQ